MFGKVKSDFSNVIFLCMASTLINIDLLLLFCNNLYIVLRFSVINVTPEKVGCI